MAKKRTGINQVGRPQHLATVANQRLVADLARYGVPQNAIAQKLGITDDTLRKHYKEQLKTAKIDDHVEIAAKAVEMAKAGNETMIKYYLDNLGGDEWRKKPAQLEVTGANGGPIAVQRFDYDAIPVEQTRYLEQVLDAVVVNEEDRGE